MCTACSIRQTLLLNLPDGGDDYDDGDDDDDDDDDDDEDDDDDVNFDDADDDVDLASVYPGQHQVHVLITLWTL